VATLHHTIVSFFEARMTKHSRVERFTRMLIADEYVYAIERTDGFGSVNVFLSDAYRFGRADYVGRPNQITRGDFILIARPEADFDVSLVERARKNGIGIGKIGKLMGALNYKSVWPAPGSVDSILS